MNVHKRYYSRYDVCPMSYLCMLRQCKWRKKYAAECNKVVVSSERYTVNDRPLFRSRFRLCVCDAVEL